MKILVLVGAFVAGALAVPEAKADAEADPWGGYGYYGKRDAEPTAEPTADAEADADAWYGAYGYAGLGYAGYAGYHGYRPYTYGYGYYRPHYYGYYGKRS